MKRIYFHVKTTAVFLFFAMSMFHVKAQGTIQMADRVITYNLPIDKALQQTLQNTPDYQKLSGNDQQVLYYLNYARKNPDVFLKNAINVFVAGHPEIKSSYIGSLQKTFAALNPLGVILPDAKISAVAMNHANDLRQHQSISHNSSNGQTFQQRLKGYLNGCGSECIHATMRYNPIEVVLGLLFDFNVSDLGHRKALLNPQFTKAGVGSSVVTNNFSVAVMDFSCQ